MGHPGYDTWEENERHARRAARLERRRKRMEELSWYGYSSMPPAMLEQLWEIRMLPEAVVCPASERYGVEVDS